MNETVYLVRFLGDPTGYRVKGFPNVPSHHRWIEATVGKTDRVVWIDVSKAYKIEEAP